MSYIVTGKREMEKQGRERGDKGCVCSWKKGVMGVKKDGRKEEEVGEREGKRGRE